MILVTGAGGNVGGALIAALAAEGRDFRAAYHSPDKLEKARRDGREAILLDFANPATLPPAMAGIDAVVLIGATGPSQAEQETNVVEAAKATGVKHLVKVSAWGAAEEQFSFARMHRQIERAIEASGLAWTFLRPNGFMQNFVNHMAGSIKTKDAFFQPAGEARISHIDVRDIAQVAARVLAADGHEGMAYDLSGPQALTYGEEAATLSSVLGRPISYVSITDDAARAGMLAVGLPEFYADSLVDLFRVYRTGAAERVTSAVKDITGRDPISFDQFARDYAQAFR